MIALKEQSSSPPSKYRFLFRNNCRLTARWAGGSRLYPEDATGMDGQSVGSWTGKSTKHRGPWGRDRTLTEWKRGRRTTREGVRGEEEGRPRKVAVAWSLRRAVELETLGEGRSGWVRHAGGEDRFPRQIPDAPSWLARTPPTSLGFNVALCMHYDQVWRTFLSACPAIKQNLLNYNCLNAKNLVLRTSGNFIAA